MLITHIYETFNFFSRRFTSGADVEERGSQSRFFRRFTFGSRMESRPFPPNI